MVKMRPYWIRTLTTMTYVLIKGQWGDRETQEEGHEITQAETGVLQHKPRKEGSQRSRKKLRMASVPGPPWSRRGAQPANHFMSDF